MFVWFRYNLQIFCFSLYRMDYHLQLSLQTDEKCSVLMEISKTLVSITILHKDDIIFIIKVC